ncbi:MAG: ricin-type beta-trefoil lectin domain protein [Chrysiogenetes bacterium]|nr:ricin-type beta-trefoil lectin domain protein [Chrysiogenetes bacterium]
MKFSIGILAALMLSLSAGTALAGGSTPPPPPPSTPSADVAWAKTALALQRQIDVRTPFKDATFLGTHNSYNSQAYQTIFSYLDPNQSNSLSTQLFDSGARFIELDVHNAYNDLLLCHGQDNHVGCSAFDRPFWKGLEELRKFLTRYPEEVVLLYIEDHMDGKYNDALSDILSQLGSHIYTPAGNCTNIATNLTKADVLAAGKQVLLLDPGCDGNSAWDSIVFSGIGSGGFPTEQVEDLNGFPACNGGANYENMVRFYEDRTNLSSLFSDPGDPLTTSNIDDVLKCGGNIVGFDMLGKDDARMTAAIWSWAPGEPNNYNSNEDCGESRGDGRFNDVNCANTRQYACRKPGTKQWYVTNGAGPWITGELYCSAETGGQFLFDVPTSASDNEALKSAKAARGAGTVWLNYQDADTEGTWLVGHEGKAAKSAQTIFQNKGSKCMDDSSARAAAGANVHLWDCHGKANQFWLLDSDGLIHSGVNYNRCLEAAGWGTANGTNIQLGNCHGGDNQVWIYDGQTLASALAPGKVIDVSGNGSSNGTNIQLWSANGSQAQRWTAAKFLSIKSVGKCLDVSGYNTGNGTNIHASTCHGGDNQKWWHDERGLLRSLMHPGKCLDVEGKSTSNGANIHLWDCHGGDNQVWIYDGTFLRSKMNQSKVVDVSGDDNVHLWGYHGGANQQMKFE